MSRTLTPAMLAEIAKSRTRYALLIHFQFSTSIYTTTWTNDITYNGNTYTPNAGVMLIPTIEETADLKVDEIDIVISGANLTNIAVALNENYIDKKIIFYQAMLDDSFNVIADPIQHDYRVSGFEFSEDPVSGNSVLVWNAASHWEDFNKIAGRRTNNEDQQLYFPGDLGLEFTTTVIKDLKWGK